jgi:hypothetical protein
MYMALDGTPARSALFPNDLPILGPSFTHILNQMGEKTRNLLDILLFIVSSYDSLAHGEKPVGSGCARCYTHANIAPRNSL